MCIKRISATVYFLPLVSMSAIVLLSGSALADIAQDMTKPTLAMTMVISVIIIAFMGLSIVLNLREGRSISKRTHAIVLAVVGLLVIQAIVYTGHEPWYDKVTREEDNKPQFEFYKPLDDIDHTQLSLVVNGLGDAEPTFFNDSYYIVYSRDAGEDYVLVSVNSTDGENWSTPTRLDNVPWTLVTDDDLKGIIDIHLITGPEGLTCHYRVLDYGAPDDRESRKVTTIDGLTWSPPEVTGGLEIRLKQAPMPLPGRFNNFGWTHLRDSAVIETEATGYILVAEYRGEGLDVIYDLGTFFAHSRNGFEWTNLTFLGYWEDWRDVELQEISRDRFMAFQDGTSRNRPSFDVVLFDVDDFYEVNGPHTSP
jgi:hypothetical protein